MRKQAVKTSKGRNSEVDFWRLVFALVVVVHHSHGLRPPDPQRYPFVGGYLAVEFFLILTGYFSVQKCEAYQAKGGGTPNVLQWTAKKFSRIYLYAVPAILLHYLADIAVHRLPFRDGLKELAYGIFEVLLLPASGIYESFLNLPIWYLSAMLLVLPVFFLMLVKLGENTVSVICFLSPLLIYGYFSKAQGHIDLWSVWTGLFHISLIRVWAGFCVGWMVYHGAKWLGALRLTAFGERALSAVELVCGGIVLFYMFTRTRRRLDFLCVGLLAVFSSIMLSERASWHPCFLPWWGRAARFSLSLYVSHWTIRMLLPVMMPTAAYPQMLGIYFALSCLYAGFLMVLADGIQKYFPRDKIKRKLCFPLTEREGK